MKRAASAVFSFEVVFVLFLFAGRFKEDPRFDWVPVDTTVLLLLGSLAAGGWVFYKRRGKMRRSPLLLTGLLGLFFTFCGFSYFWSPSTAYAIEKIGYLWVLTFWSFLGCAFIISRDQARLRRFFVVIMVFSSWFVFEALGAFLSADLTGQQVYALGTRYLGLGRVIGLGSIVLFIYAISATRSKMRRLLFLVLFFGHVATLLVIGGRGPLLATVAGLLVPVYFGTDWDMMRAKVSVQRYVKPIIASLFVSIVGVILFLPSGALTTILRLQVLFSNDVGASAGMRIQMYEQALEIWSVHPFGGAGIGGWPVLAGWGDQKMYPHNLFLEILSEYGIIGFILVSTFAFYAFRKLFAGRPVNKSILKIVVLSIFANAFVNAMLTGDLSDNRVLFAMVGLFLYSPSERDQHCHRT